MSMFLKGRNFKLGDVSQVISTTSTGLSYTKAIATSDLWHDAAGNAVTPDYAYEGGYVVTVLGTTQTDITVQVMNLHKALGTTDYYAELTRFTVPATTTLIPVDKYVQGFWIGDGAALISSNVSTAASTAGSSAITVYARVTKP
jgi:hypothetical protein